MEPTRHVWEIRTKGGTMSPPLYKPFEANIDYTEPVDILEPLENKNEYREASLHFLRILTLALMFIVESKDPVAAAWGVSFALNLSPEGKSMRQIGLELNLSSGTVSHAAKSFRRYAGLPVSIYQQDLEQADQSRQNRLKQL